MSILNLQHSSVIGPAVESDCHPWNTEVCRVLRKMVHKIAVNILPPIPNLANHLTHHNLNSHFLTNRHRVCHVGEQTSKYDK